MQRNVYLQGELGDMFGRKFVVATNDYADIFKCINVNRPEFLPYLKKCHEEGIGFIVDTEEGSIDNEDLIRPIAKGDVTIAIAPAGSKKGLTKILVAIAIIAFLVFNPLSIAGGGNLLAAGAFEAGTIGAYAVQASVAIATSLALQGIQQLMAPDPSVDKNDGTSNYLFSGGASNAKEGDPIPILYGELRVPGRPISIEVVQGSSTAFNIDNIYVDADGGVHNIDLNFSDIA
jgi:predicted phage tail protein